MQNWSPMWKASAIFCATLVSFSQGFGPLALVGTIYAGYFGQFVDESRRLCSEIISRLLIRILKALCNLLVSLSWSLDSQISSGMFLVLDYEFDLPSSRVPIQTCFGRRPVLILSLLICFGSSIWRAKANSYNSFMGACV